MGYKTFFQNFITLFIKGFEGLCLKWPFFRETYGHLIYQSVIDREATLSGLKKGSKVLHIGSGAMPFTALSLAEVGFKVVALDNDAKAVEKSTDLISFLGKGCDIEVRVGDGCVVDYSGFHGIWVSLHVHPKEEIVQRAVSQMDRGTCLVLREPRSWLARIYPRLDQDSLIPQAKISRFPQAIGKETIIITKA